MGFAATVAGPEASTQADAGVRRTGARAPDLPLDADRGIGNQALLRRRTASPPAVASGRTSGPLVQREVDPKAKILEIEAGKYDMPGLLAACEALDEPGLRRKMIDTIGADPDQIHKSINEERQLAALLAVDYKGKMMRADFANVFAKLLARLPGDQSLTVLNYVGPKIIGQTSTLQNVGGEVKSVPTPKQSINDKGMKGAPGSSIAVGGNLFVFVECGVQFKDPAKDKTLAGGPAARNNNPGNITVGDGNPDAWKPDIGAYVGRYTEGRYAIFPTLDVGREAMKKWARLRGAMTIEGYFKAYAPNTDLKNDSTDYANAVIDAVKPKLAKVGMSTTVKEVIDAGALDQFTEAQEKKEGFTASKDNVTCLPVTSPDLPAEVRTFAAGFTAKDDMSSANKVAATAAADTPAAAPPNP